MLYLMLDGLTVFHKGDFRCIRCFKDGSILDSACHFWGDLYLNSTTILFDSKIIIRKDIPSNLGGSGVMLP